MLKTRRRGERERARARTDRAERGRASEGEKSEKLNRQHGRGKIGARVERNSGIDEDKCETNIGSDKMNALRYIIK